MMMYKISRFSMLCRLSPRMLRHYDKLDILKPAVVDEGSGYRHYTGEQALEAIEIIKLKRYHFTLDEIRKILKEKDAAQFKQILKSKIDMIDRKVRDKADVIEEMEKLIDQDRELIVQSEQDYAILSGFQPDRSVAKRRDTIEIKDMDAVSEELYSWAQNNDLEPYNYTGAHFLSRFFDDSNTKVEIFIPLKNAVKSNWKHPIDQRGNLVSVIPGHIVVSTIHAGRYDGIGTAYLALEKWLLDSEYEVLGHPYEIYLRSTESGVPETDFLTQICFPLKTV